jgi:hypothetical protein
MLYVLWPQLAAFACTLPASPDVTGHAAAIAAAAFVKRCQVARLEVMNGNMVRVFLLLSCVPPGSLNFAVLAAAAAAAAAFVMYLIQLQVARLEVVNGNMVRVFLRGSASGAAAGVAVAGGAPGAAATAGGQITSDDLFAAGTGNEGEWGSAASDVTSNYAHHCAHAVRQLTHVCPSLTWGTCNHNRYLHSATCVCRC